MNRQAFTFRFPMSGETITRQLNLLAVKDVTTGYLSRQSEVRGNLCIVFDQQEAVVAMAYIDDHMRVSFFTEDTSISDIKTLYNAEYDEK